MTLRHYNFDRLIRKYSSSFTLVIPTGGEYIGGQWQATAPEEHEYTGAVVPIMQRTSISGTGDGKNYHEGGTYAKEDRQLYMTSPIKHALEGAKVIYKGMTYSVEQGVDYGDFAGVWIYTLKWVKPLD